MKQTSMKNRTRDIEKGTDWQWPVGKREGKAMGLVKKLYEGPMDMHPGWGLAVGGGEQGKGEKWGKLGQLQLNNNKKIKQKKWNK